MNLEIITYLLYLSIGGAAIVAVGSLLATNGQVFLEEASSGDRRAAAAMNHLLQVGYYLVTFGLLAATMRAGSVARPADLFAVLSGKVGVLLLAIAALYLLNLSIFLSARRTRRLARATPYPSYHPVGTPTEPYAQPMHQTQPTPPVGPRPGPSR